jgi:hypothetical protein
MRPADCNAPRETTFVPTGRTKMDRQVPDLGLEEAEVINTGDELLERAHVVAHEIEARVEHVLNEPDARQAARRRKRHRQAASFRRRGDHGPTGGWPPSCTPTGQRGADHGPAEGPTRRHS